MTVSFCEKEFYCSRELANQTAALDRCWTTRPNAIFGPNLCLIMAGSCDYHILISI